MRLSTTLDCWKNSCHGATVVPTIGDDEQQHRRVQPTREAAGPARRHRRFQRRDAPATPSGTISTFTAITSRNINRSQRRNDPPATTANSSTAAAGTATAFGQAEEAESQLRRR